MKWLLILTFWQHPIVVVDYYASQDDCRHAGQVVRAQTIHPQNVQVFCVPVSGVPQ